MDPASFAVLRKFLMTVVLVGGSSSLFLLRFCRVYKFRWHPHYSAVRLKSVQDICPLNSSKIITSSSL